jgi:ABC-2 type transport system ATP-binding protein
VTTHNMEEAEECTRLVVLVAGRVVAAGTSAQITGQARTPVVRAADWPEALRRLEAACLRAVLAGDGLRVPGGTAAEVTAALGELPADVSTGPATLEERFFQLAADG